jgi:predicted DNA-binding protein
VPARLQLRLPDETHERLRVAALRDGVTVSEFVRRAVEDRIEGRTAKALGRAVALEAVPEIERVLSERAAEAAAAAVPFVGPKPFERGCEDADLQRVGEACHACGGSF